ncbi:glycerophosphodiester phosphodiesterase family protein [Cohaesibacter intestini]|uniref:glycerophosphodiester phosphodiesterase family protein n=1 Tax=Cohaesibacter intestini TaxID=2211145 RepID=UPI0018E4F131|nr:glycerophosphodiester phosphodiesterase family protein [Cohaesibacter intestini]
MRDRNFFNALMLKPAIVAHRGHWVNAPENSLASIDAAASAGFEVAEIDIQRSDDGVFFLMHDEMLTRMTGSEFPCHQMSIAQLQAMPLRQGCGGRGSGFSHHVIPTLAEALKLAKRRIFLNLDVKHDEDLAFVAKLVAQMDMQGEASIKVTVQTEVDAQYLLALEEEHGLMVMPKTRFDAENCSAMIEQLRAVEATLVEARFDSLYTLVAHRAEFEQAGLTLWVNTLDRVACCGFSDKAAQKAPDAIWGSLTEAGIGVIQTDAPQVLAAWRQSHMPAFTYQAKADKPHLPV